MRYRWERLSVGLGWIAVFLVGSMFGTNCQVSVPGVDVNVESDSTWAHCFEGTVKVSDDHIRVDVPCLNLDVRLD
jgi:hypothetical protein